MAVKVVTDSVGDVPPQVAEELGITVVPLFVRFGTEVYRDGVDLTYDEFYHKLVHSQTLPVTIAPSPGTFAETYDKLAEETDEIVSIHLSAKLSGTYDSALQGRGVARKGCRIEVIDSLFATAGQGILVIAAAKAAREGANLDEIVEMVGRSIPRIHLRAAFDTLEYLRRGGRIGKAQAFLGTMLKVNPILGIKDGEVFPFGRERSRSKAIDYLYNFALSFPHIQEMVVGHATTPDEAEALVDRLDARFPKERIYRLRCGCIVGTHVGPHVISVCVLEGEGGI